MSWWKRTLVVLSVMVLTLTLLSVSPVLADEPAQGHSANNVPPDTSTLRRMPPPSPLELAVSALKENASAKVAEITALKRQGHISDQEWRSRLLKIKDEVNVAKRALGLPVAPPTANKLNSQNLEFTTESLDYLSGMTYINQTSDCKNGCGVASATEVLDYEHVAYGGDEYTFEQVQQDLGLTCCDTSGCSGVCLSNYTPSIEHTLEVSGTASFEVHAPASESGWFNDIITSITSWGYPQVMLTKPNFDSGGDYYLHDWENESSSSHHYIVVSGYNDTDGNVWYQESAWWTPGDKWWPKSSVWQVNDHADASQGCASPYKLIW